MSDSQEYEAYLRTPHWAETRLKALARADHRCQLCNSAKRLQVHHRTYERLGREADADLTVLCERCHRAFHQRRNVVSPAGPKYCRGDLAWTSVKEFITACEAGGLWSSSDVALMTGINASRAGTRLKDLERLGYVKRRGKRWLVLNKAAKDQRPNERNHSRNGAVRGSKSLTVLRPGEGIITQPAANESGKPG